MNTGVGDAVDIGWKLAAVLQGWGGTKLLDSYTAERKPIAMINVNEAAEMRASFDNQTPFSPQIAKTARKENSCVKRRARQPCARAQKNSSTTRPESNSATVMRTHRSASPTARRRPAGSRPLRAIDMARRARAARLVERRPLDPGFFGKGFALLNFPGMNTNTITAGCPSRRLPLETSPSTKRKCARLTNAIWCLCGLTATSLGAAMKSRKTSLRSSIKYAAQIEATYASSKIP